MILLESSLLFLFFLLFSTLSKYNDHFVCAARIPFSVHVDCVEKRVITIFTKELTSTAIFFFFFKVLTNWIIRKKDPNAEYIFYKYIYFCTSSFNVDFVQPINKTKINITK